MKYNVVITETLQRVVPVEASSPEEALDQVRNDYREEVYVLDADDYVDTSFEVYGYEDIEGEPLCRDD